MEISMHSGVLDLKTRRKLSLAPAAAGAAALAEAALGEVMGNERADQPQLGLRVRIDRRSAREEKSFIVSIRCVRALRALRREPHLQRLMARGILTARKIRWEDQSASAPAPLAHGKARRPRRRRRRPAPESRS